MFCPSCSCELPAVAKFCVRCGSPVAIPSTTNRSAETSFCMNCAKRLDRADKLPEIIRRPRIGHSAREARPRSIPLFPRRQESRRFLHPRAERHPIPASSACGWVHPLPAALLRLTSARIRAIVAQVPTRKSAWLKGGKGAKVKG